MFEAAPQAFDEHVVQRSTPSIHVDADVRILPDSTDEGLAGELGALVRIEDLRRSVVAECLRQAGDTERTVHGVRQSPGKNPFGNTRQRWPPDT